MFTSSLCEIRARFREGNEKCGGELGGASSISDTSDMMLENKRLEM